MAKCKACGAWFAPAEPQDLCPTCERALKRLKDYVAPVVHGQWADNIGGFFEVSSCSICGERCITTGITAKYCPNCGAKIDGET